MACRMRRRAMFSLLIVIFFLPMSADNECLYIPIYFRLIII